MVKVLLVAGGLGGEGCVTLRLGVAVTEVLTMLEPAGRSGQHQRQSIGI